ncbi:MAG: hypothetical protein KDD04_07015 [Sinomicrobium sp.]|nr:hypothetical protein [Sinomicrobium sp.]
MKLKHTLFSILAVATLGYGSAWGQLTHDSTILIQAKDKKATSPVGITQNLVGGGSAMEFTTKSATGQATRMILRGNTSNADIEFYTGERGAEKVSVFIEGTNGNVGIGTPTPKYKLHVKGQVHADTYSAETPPWSDFVFEDTYNLRSLKAVESYIKENKHLPDVPSEAELKETGLNLPEMDAKLLQKIEELTLYLIEQNKKIEAQQKEIETLKKKIAE